MTAIVTLVHIRPDAEVAIGRAAARCYDSDRSTEACLRRADHCTNINNHLAVLRFAWAHFAIEGLSRVASHQLVRVAHAGILQESQRYVKQTAIQFVDPPALRDMPAHIRAAWHAVQAGAESTYLAAIDAGMKKEDARFVLPQGCTTSLEIAGNFQMFKDLLANRTSRHAQWEIRDAAIQMQNMLHEHAPRIFKRID